LTSSWNLVIALMDNQSKISSRSRISRGELKRITLPEGVLVTLGIFVQAYSVHEKAIERSLQSAGINRSQFMALWALLLSEQPLTPTDISNLIPIETQSVTTVLDRLEERELIVREHSKQDRRVIQLTLTAQGEQVVRQIAPAVITLITDVFGTLSASELQSLSCIAAKIRDANIPWLDKKPQPIEDMLRRVFRSA